MLYIFVIPTQTVLVGVGYTVFALSVRRVLDFKRGVLISIFSGTSVYTRQFTILSAHLLARLSFSAKCSRICRQVRRTKQNDYPSAE